MRVVPEYSPGAERKEEAVGATGEQLSVFDCEEEGEWR